MRLGPMTGKRYDNKIVGTAGRQLSKPFFNGRQGCLLVSEQRRLAANVSVNSAWSALASWLAQLSQLISVEA